MPNPSIHRTASGPLEKRIAAHFKPRQPIIDRSARTVILQTHSQIDKLARQDPLPDEFIGSLAAMKRAERIAFFARLERSEPDAGEVVLRKSVAILAGLRSLNRMGITRNRLGLIRALEQIAQRDYDRWRLGLGPVKANSDLRIKGPIERIHRLLGSDRRAINQGQKLFRIFYRDAAQVYRQIEERMNDRGFRRRVLLESVPEGIQQILKESLKRMSPKKPGPGTQ